MIKFLWLLHLCYARSRFREVSSMNFSKLHCLARIMLNLSDWIELYFEGDQRVPLSLDKYLLKRQKVSYEQMWLTTTIINDNNNCHHLLSSCSVLGTHCLPSSTSVIHNSYKGLTK